MIPDVRHSLCALAGAAAVEACVDMSYHSRRSPISCQLRYRMDFAKLPIVASDAQSATRSSLAPAGKLRAGINYSNFVLATRDPSTGQPRGIAAELAREIAKRLDVPLEFVTFDSAGRMADAAASGVWDIAFLANEPERASRIAFSPPYLEIEAGYLVPPGSPIRSIAAADAAGLRIAIAEKSAYDLFLSRSLQHARLVPAKGMDGSYELFVAEKLDLLAGIKPWLKIVAGKMPGSRVLDGRFMAVQQCIGSPKEREPGAAYLREFVEEIKRSGFVSSYSPA
jgi:polar amino acid transport system substrate-binding protein